MCNKIISTKRLVFGLAFIIALLFTASDSGIGFIANTFAQEQVASPDTVQLNETQKQIFGEAKKAANEDKNTRNSLIMIGAVLCVVALAMYLAFKNDDTDKKQTFARTPKKDF